MKSLLKVTWQERVEMGIRHTLMTTALELLSEVHVCTRHEA